LLGACGSSGHSTASTSPAPTGAAARDPVLIEGRDLYAAHCASCHGASGQGGVGPSFSNGRLLRDFRTVAAQLAFVHRRRIGTALRAAQLRAVTRYEREVLASRR
jgi:mono/diheme cytochrome c family protein